MDSETTPPQDCAVTGVLVFVLHVSRIAGIAPIKLQRLRGGWRMRLSRLYFFYDFLVVIVILTLSAWTALSRRDDVVDGFEAASNTGFMRVYTKIILLTQLTVAFIVISNCFNRFRDMIDCLAQLDQINKEFDRLYPQSPTSEGKMWCFVIFLIIHGYFGSFMEYCMYLYDVKAVNNNVPLISLSMMSGYFYVVHLQLYPLQFFLVIMQVQSAQKRLNNALRSLHQTIYVHYFKTKSQILIQLTNIYCSLCDIVRKQNESNGASLLMVLLFVARNFVTTPYFVVSILYRSHAAYPVLKALCAIAWSSVCLSMLIVVVEPCHRVHYQFYQTKDLVYHILRLNLKGDSEINRNIKKFRRHILLNSVCFRPMQLIMFDRYIILAVFTTVVKYLSLFMNL